MARRYYSSTAARTTLAADINSSVTTVGVNAVTGWPTSFPYTIIIDQDTVNEEVVEVTARTGTTLTVVRGVDGTTGVAHSNGAAVNHGVSARDFDEPNAFINGTGVVTSGMIANGTIVDADVNASAAIAQSKVSGLVSALAAKANLASPTFTGTPAAPTAAAGTNTIQLATTAFVLANSGKILQVVRATDITNRSTTSTSFVDVTGMSVTITPQKSTSAILIIANFLAYPTSGSQSLIVQYAQITDASNNAISGAEGSESGGADNAPFSGTSAYNNQITLFGYATPATTSPVTYKLRFKSVNAAVTAQILDATNTGQLFAIEVSA